MMKRKLGSNGWLFAALLGLAVGACGGPPQPADGPTDPPPLDDTGEPDAPVSSPEVDAARSAIEGGDFATAKTALDKALAKAPKDPQAHYYYGVVLEQGGDTAGAAGHYKQALEADPKMPEPAVNLSSILLEVDKDPAGALKVVLPALKLTPLHPGLLMNHALILEALGKADEALVAYGKASAAAPENVELRFAYADLLAAAGKKAEAKKELLAITTDDVKLLGAMG